MATYIPLEWFESEDWIISAAINDGQGNDLDINGATIRWRIYNKHGTVFEANTTNDMITIDHANTGLATIGVNITEHANVFPNTYHHECKVVLANTMNTVQFYGVITIKNSPF